MIEQRELKFRAWDSNKKKWIYFDLGDLAFSNPKQWDCVDLQNANQFTSFKDKNKKEIYAGDIIKWGCIESPDIPDKFFVIFREYADEEGDNTDNHYGWDCQSLGKNRCHTLIDIVKPKNFQLGYCEIIGNIIENSELLLIK